MTQTEIQKAAANMIISGGSFMRNLGKALQVADKENTEKILAQWGYEIANFLKF